MSWTSFFPYLIVMAGVTYLIRMLPLTVFRREIKSRFVKSFLHYVPLAVLSVMTIPAVFYATSNIYSAIAGFVSAVILAYFGGSLLTVAALASAAVFVVELIMNYI